MKKKTNENNTLFLFCKQRGKKGEKKTERKRGGGGRKQKVTLDHGGNFKSEKLIKISLIELIL